MNGVFGLLQPVLEPKAGLAKTRQGPVKFIAVSGEAR